MASRGVRTRMTGGGVATLLTVVLTALGLAVAAAPAGAEPTVPASAADTTTTADTAGAAAAAGTVRTPSTTPLPTTQVDGIVWASTTVGTTVYAVGKFTTARPAGAAAGTQTTPRGNILAFDVRTGVLSTSFVHDLNAEARTVTASPDGTRLYVGGQFTAVDGQARSRIAAFSVATGALLPFAPKPNYTVNTIAATNTTVYFGGAFSTVGSAPRARLAATDTAGTLLPWAPTATGTVRGLVALPRYSRVYAAGSFSSFNGSATRGVSAADATTGATVPVPVSSQVIASGNNSDNSGIYDLRTDGTRIYGGGYNFYGQGGAAFEGTFALDPASGSTLWVNDCWGDTYDTTPVGGLLYVASHAHDCSWAGFFPDTGAHYFGLAFGVTASARHNVRDTRGWDYSAFPTSSLTDWRPRFTQGAIAGQAVWSFTGGRGYVVAAGEFPSVNGVAQQGLVRFALS